MLVISNNVTLQDDEIELTAIRSQGAGGQNVNKVSSAIHLRFDIQSSSLPEFYKQRLLSKKDQRITKDGVIIIKSQQHRTQEKNRQEALERLATIIKSAGHIVKKRKPTKPSYGSRQKRMDSKTRQGQKKQWRRKVED